MTRRFRGGTSFILAVLITSPSFAEEVQAPAAVIEVSDPPPEISPTKKAPTYALWIGGRASVIGYLNSFYTNSDGTVEPASNYVKPGPAFAVDVGARIGKRLIPFAFFEHAFLAKGEMLREPSYSYKNTDDYFAYSNYYGVGLRYLVGNVDAVAFAAEWSLGQRTIGVSNGDNTFTMSGFEYLHLGLGAEIRFSSRLTLSPMATISSGTLTTADGTIDSPGLGPCFSSYYSGECYYSAYDDGSIPRQASYLVLGIGVGAHFDLFGSSPPY